MFFENTGGSICFNTGSSRKSCRNIGTGVMTQRQIRLFSYSYICIFKSGIATSNKCTMTRDPQIENSEGSIADEDEAILGIIRVQLVEVS